MASSKTPTKSSSISAKPWGGRFTEPTNELVEAFTESISFDSRLYKQDIQGSIAHSKMLAKIGVISGDEAARIERGLIAIGKQIDEGDFEWSTQLEDVHMNIEARLTENIGEAGKKLHTGRSRNDQVATDIRLYMRQASDDVIALIKTLQTNLLTSASEEVDTILPGFTHLQVAQPISLAHHLLAWNEMLERDVERFQDCRKRINVMPLGSAALAGTSFPLDRNMTCELLEFERPSRNSLDSVSDRDFLIEYASAASLVMMHLSRMCEEIILWASESYKFIDIGDAFCTGSSIMPQKKNPDIAEIIRGKSGRVIGNLQALLVLMKSQPLAYNRDRDTMYQAALGGYATATDLAEYLVRLEVPFRDAHEIVGSTVHYAIEQGKPLSDLSLEELQSFGAMIQEDVYDVLTLEGSVNARSHFGGTAPARVREALAAAKDRLNR